MSKLSVLYDKCDQLAAIEGLTLADCIQFFNNKATLEEREKAALVAIEDEGFECDNSLISEGDDNGCYVLGWRWVSFEGTRFDKGEP